MALAALVRAVVCRRPRLTRVEEYARGVLATAQAFESESQLEVEGSTVLLVSDLHANTFGAALVERLARRDLFAADLVLVAGDVTDGGTATEARLVAGLLSPGGARAGRPREGGPEAAPTALIVGGNHDGAGALDALVASGYEVLEGRCVERAGLRVFGASDPLARSTEVDSDAERLAAQAAELAALWPGLGDPDILLVHDLRQAEAVARVAQARGASLVVACGNDHRAAVERRGTVTIVNAGTAGASGYGALGRGEPVAYSAQVLQFGSGPRPRLRRVTTLRYDPDGRSSAVSERVDG